MAAGKNRGQPAPQNEAEDDSSQPTHDALAVLRYRKTNKETGETEWAERLVELGPCWPTRNGHMRLKMFTTPLEWLNPNCHERTIMIVRRSVNRA